MKRSQARESIEAATNAALDRLFSKLFSMVFLDDPAAAPNFASGLAALDRAYAVAMAEADKAFPEE